MSDETHVALISGGQDSAVAAHVSMRFGPCDVLMYLDTGTGLKRNERYVERFADKFGWHLIKWRTPENYEELVKKYGFPGPSKHAWFYQYLKERQIGKLATIGDEVHYWTGVHKAESDNRMANVEEMAEDQSGRWYWHAPCANWTATDFRRYFDRFNLPVNPLWHTLGRSGDCYCGAYGNRMELIDLDALGCERSDWIRDIESDLDTETAGFDDPERSKWGWHDDQPSAWAIEDDAQMTLCSHCGTSYPQPSEE